MRELGDLKRITSAGREGSIATRLFTRAWGHLIAGANPRAVMLDTTGRALAAARLGDLDREALAALDLPAPETAAVLAEAVAAVAAPFDPALVHAATAALSAPPLPQAAPPPFVALLAAQPRAGVTCPGRPRAMLLPPESHADHCLAVAVYAALLAPAYAADPTRAFMAGMVHHLHSAAMPDSGYTGEMLLEPHLARVIAAARAQARAQLPPALATQADELQAEIATDTTPAARAFHAADAIDRVLEIENHLARARLTMDAVLNDYALVHDGPVKAFQDRVLADVGLA